MVENITSKAKRYLIEKTPECPRCRFTVDGGKTIGWPLGFLPSREHPGEVALVCTNCGYEEPARSLGGER